MAVGAGVQQLLEQSHCPSCRGDMIQVTTTNLGTQPRSPCPPLCRPWESLGPLCKQEHILCTARPQRVLILPLHGRCPGERQRHPKS